MFANPEIPETILKPRGISGHIFRAMAPDDLKKLSVDLDVTDGVPSELDPIAVGISLILVGVDLIAPGINPVVVEVFHRGRGTIFLTFGSTPAEIRIIPTKRSGQFPRLSDIARSICATPVGSFIMALS